MNSNKYTVVLILFLMNAMSAKAQLFGGQIKSSNSITSLYPNGTIFCISGPTAVVDVTNPTTGKIWMDRNLGASQVATSSTDANSYGDLYQWGRRSDGHQCRSSATTTILSTTDQPAHGDFIVRVSILVFDWRNPQNANLWQGVNGVNNPCPIGYRIPTSAELDSERLTWNVSDFNQAFNSTLKLPAGGERFQDGIIANVGVWANYLSSTTATSSSFVLNIYPSCSSPPCAVIVGSYQRIQGGSVRCIKN